MRMAAKMLGVSASTLSRRGDLDWVSAGQWMRLRPREVMKLASVYQKRKITEVGEDLIRYAEHHAHAHVGTVKREVEEYMREMGSQSAAMAALDKKIQERAKLRREDPVLAELTATKAGEKRYAGSPARMKAIDEFLRAFRDWQNQGYTFGAQRRTIDQFDYSRSKVGARYSGQATLKAGKAGQGDLEYVLIEASESANPSDADGRERVNWSNEPADGVFLFGSVQVKKTEGGGGNYKPAQMYLKWFSMEELDQVKLALVEMLEELVDVINPREGPLMEMEI